MKRTSAIQQALGLTAKEKKRLEDYRSRSSKKDKESSVPTTTHEGHPTRAPLPALRVARAPEPSPAPLRVARAPEPSSTPLPVVRASEPCPIPRVVSASASSSSPRVISAPWVPEPRRHMGGFELLEGQESEFLQTYRSSRRGRR